MGGHRGNDGDGGRRDAMGEGMPVTMGRGDGGGGHVDDVLRPTG